MCRLIFIAHACGHLIEVGTTQCELWTNTDTICDQPTDNSEEEDAPCYECTIRKCAAECDLEDLNIRAYNLLQNLEEHVTDTRMRSDFSEKVTASAMKAMKQYIDMYSAKVKLVDWELRQERVKRVAERERRLGEREKWIQEREVRNSEIERRVGLMRVEIENEILSLDGDRSFANASEEFGPMTAEMEQETQQAEEETSQKIPPNTEAERGRLRELETKVEHVDRFWRDQVRGHETQLEAAGRSHSTWRVAPIMVKLDAAHNIWNNRMKEAFDEATAALSSSYTSFRTGVDIKVQGVTSRKMNSLEEDVLDIVNRWHKERSGYQTTMNAFQVKSLGIISYKDVITKCSKARDELLKARFELAEEELSNGSK
ncbi:hypothetical protein BJ878DRAFT_544587 [Calycina marina]|uniref:Uncharacterized protein n=1 Tax=Calycina marina TaxID=1763456 RepID=A0A9P7YYK8_9HELO|nr:hypothetical protein BJ878DRAFT_544587 [Calycina marina]